MTRRIILIFVIAGIVLTIALLQRDRVMAPFGEAGRDVEVTADAKKEGTYPRAQELTDIEGFLNSEPFALSDYIGEKVILIDFWTYSCINCQRTLPYLKEWWGRYEDDGLLIVGVHTPEFEFEKDPGNVQAALEKYGVTYPVVLDNGYGTWRAYRNQYWPRKYLIDADGYIVYDHIGEGAYEETERAIRAALEELHGGEDMTMDITDEISLPLDAPVVDHRSVGSPEVYFGALRNRETLGNGRSGTAGEQTVSIPERIDPNRTYLEGTWLVTEEYAQNLTAGARVVFRYSAKSVNLVAGADDAMRITVLRDGKAIGTAGGADVSDGTVMVEADTLYNIVDDSGYGEHTLELIIESPGVRLFTFTFG